MTKINKQEFSGKFAKTAVKSLLLGASCIFLTAGCASNMANYNGAEQQTRNEVEMVRIPYSIHFESGTTAMSNEEVGKLNYFLRTASISYGDEFSMDFPLDRNGDVSDLDQERLAYVSNMLKDSGLNMSGKVTPYGMEPTSDTGRLLISRYVVTPPECGDWSQRSNPNYENAPLTNLGCASQANLGLMVANPRDLIIGAKGAAPNAERTAAAVQRYQEGTTTVTPATTGSTGN